MQKRNIRGIYSLFLLFLFVSNLFPGVALAKSEPDETKNVKKQELLVAGWLEVVILEPWNIKLRAKLDTGAKTSSLHAVDIERFERDSQEWVRFHTTDPDEKEPLKFVEVPLIRDVKIKRHKQRAQIRPVVEMTFCLDGQIYTSEFSLTDRSRFNYQVLLGRRMLQQGILVDPASTFILGTNRKSCQKLMESEKSKNNIEVQSKKSSK